MNILVIGGGGREHALVWKLKQSPSAGRIFCARGNPGIAQLAECVDIAPMDHAALIAFARENEVGLTVVGPDDVIASGIVDAFEAAGLRAFGPRQAAARLESSKVFAKSFMERHGIPTARSGSFDSHEAALAFLPEVGLPAVIKADGLALGKGVIIATTREEAEAALASIMVERRFGGAGDQVVIEEFLEGFECSVHALVDGRTYLLFPFAQDHKRIGDGDTGPNTGGMGTYSPLPQMGHEQEEQIRALVMDRFLEGVRKDGLDFRGMLFPGLMMTASGPRVLEFNCRFGDPETQVLLARLEGDLVELLCATAEGRLEGVAAGWREESAVCVIMASAGYPDAVRGGFPIRGIEKAESTGAVVFHAGTRRDAQLGLVNSGGRVLGVTARGTSLGQAVEAAYDAVGRIEFEGAQYRKDIASRGLKA